MQVALHQAHNLLVDRLREDGVDEAEVFDEARRATTWHYQWVILRDFLPGLIGAGADGRAARRRPDASTGRDDDPYIPFEFADAAYRYGHSQIRDRYRVNREFGPVPVFPDLMGFGAGAARARGRLGAAVRRSRARRPRSARSASTARLPASLIALPRRSPATSTATAYHSLADARPAARPGGRAAVGRGGRARARRRAA